MSSSSDNRQASAIKGGTGTTPTPANTDTSGRRRVSLSLPHSSSTQLPRPQPFKLPYPIPIPSSPLPPLPLPYSSLHLTNRQPNPTYPINPPLTEAPHNTVLRLRQIRRPDGPKAQLRRRSGHGAQSQLRRAEGTSRVFGLHVEQVSLPNRQP